MDKPLPGWDHPVKGDGISRIPTHIYLPWIVDGKAECSHRGCTISPDWHPGGKYVEWNGPKGVYEPATGQNS